MKKKKNNNLYLLGCYTAFCLFTGRIDSEHTELKDTLEGDLGSTALQYFSSLVLEELILLSLSKCFL